MSTRSDSVYKTKYLLLLSGAVLGGAERQALGFADYLINNGRYVEIIDLSDNPTVSEVCDKKHIKYSTMLARNDLYTLCYKLLNKTGIRKLTQEEIALKGIIKNLAKYLEDNGFDVCFSYCTTANTVLGVVKKQYDPCRCIWMQRDAGIYDRTEGLQKTASENIDRIIANSRSGAEWIKKTYGRDADIVLNGVGANEHRNSGMEWRKKLGADDDSIVCTMIANLTDAKDHAFLLEVWKNLIASDDRYILVFAGSFGNTYEKLSDTVRKNNMSDNVVFAGHVADIGGLLQATDISVFSSASEGSPNGIIEACIEGLPVVATDLPEIREVVSEDNHAYLFDNHDIEQASAHIKEIAGNTELRESLGRANRAYAAKMYDPDINYGKLVSFAEE